MFQRWRAGARVLPAVCLFVVSGFGILGNSQTPTLATKVQEAAATDSAKPADSKAAEASEKQKPAVDPALDRQKQLSDDTAKLLALANELKAEMDKSSKDTLSLTVVKKAEEVEKLAHKVRDEMKKTIGN